MRTIRYRFLAWLFLRLSYAADALRMPRLGWALLFWSADMTDYFGGPVPRYLRSWREAWEGACAVERP